MKSAFSMFAFLVVGIGTGLLVRVGFSATVQPGVDVQWFDDRLVGASAGTPPTLFDPTPCADCQEPFDWLETAIASIDPAQTEEVRLIAEHLDSQTTVPLLLVDGDQITYVDPLQFEPSDRVRAMR